jgi:uncharacterized protein YggE
MTLAGFSVLGLWAAAVDAQVIVEGVPAEQGLPGVSVAGTGEVKLPADRATLRLSVQAQAPTGAEASAQLEQRVRAVTDSLRRVGVAADSVRPSSIVVSASGEMPINVRRPNEYTARVELRVPVSRLADMHAIIGAAFAAGATALVGATFESSRAEEARTTALRQAFANARQSAEVLASASGRRLGEIVNMGTAVGPYDFLVGQSGAVDYYEAGGMPARVTPREVVVRVMVQVRWRFEGAR